MPQTKAWISLCISCTELKAVFSYTVNFYGLNYWKLKIITRFMSSYSKIKVPSVTCKRCHGKGSDGAKQPLESGVPVVLHRMLLTWFW